MVAAAAIYQLAMRDEMLPRFAKADMPPLPPPDQPRTAAPLTPAGAAGEPAKPRNAVAGGQTHQSSGQEAATRCAKEVRSRG